MAHSVISGIYQIENTISGKTYIGSSNSIRRRWYEHRLHLRKGCHFNKHLQCAWDKYGESAFQMTVLELVPDRALLLLREAEWVTHLNPSYNQAEVQQGVLGSVRSPETREKIRKTRLGKKHSKEARARMSASAKSRGMPAGLKEAQRKAVTGKARPQKVRDVIAKSKRGQPLKAEHKANVSRGLREWHAKRRVLSP